MRVSLPTGSSSRRHLRFRWPTCAAWLLVIGTLLPGIAPGQEVVGRIARTPFRPSQVAVWESANRVFVADDASGRVFAYDETTLTEMGSVSVGTGVFFLAVDQSRGVMTIDEEGFGSATILAVSTSDLAVTRIVPSQDLIESAGIAATVLTATVAGRVLRDGEAVAGALTRVLVEGVERARGTSNTRGEYSVYGLAPGSYEIEVTVGGRMTQFSAGELKAGQTAVVDLEVEADESSPRRRHPVRRPE